MASHPLATHPSYSHAKTSVRTPSRLPPVPRNPRERTVRRRQMADHECSTYRGRIRTRIFPTRRGLCDLTEGWPRSRPKLGSAPPPRDCARTSARTSSRTPHRHHRPPLRREGLLRPTPHRMERARLTPRRAKQRPLDSTESGKRKCHVGIPATRPHFSASAGNHHILLSCNLIRCRSRIATRR